MTDDRWKTPTVWSSYGASIVSGWAGLAWAFEYIARSEAELAEQRILKRRRQHGYAVNDGALIARQRKKVLLDGRKSCVPI